MAILKTFDLKGNKLSFANWISNLSPSDTPFASMIKKEAVDQTMYSWQIDRLASPANIAITEGSEFASPLLLPTQVKSNFTQILRKVVRITDTANKVGLYGRASEKAYQMEKAGRELKRDLEKAMLHQIAKDAGTSATPRKFAGFQGLVAVEGLPCQDTGAVVHKTHTPAAAADPAFDKDVIFDLTYNLYLAGSKANKVMVHPKHMVIFSGFIGKHSTRMFENVDTKYNMFVGKFRDPLGQEFEIIPNRFMPENKIFFFNEADWTQMVLREPKSEQLARNGSSERHMIEMEVGLRHRNPYASGILVLNPHGSTTDKTYAASLVHPVTTIGTATRLNVAVFKDGVADTDTPSGMTIATTPNTGIGSSNATYSAGHALWDLTATKAGTYVIEVKTSADKVVAVTELVVHSEDKRMAPVSEEVAVAEEVAAPKARKAKAKAE